MGIFINRPRRDSLTLTLTLAAAMTAGAAATGNVINVPGDASSIQAGINMAVDGDEVIVADGTWTGVGNRDLDFAGRLITLRSASGDPALCIIDCERLGRGFLFHSGETTEAVVAGFTIREGWVGSEGGGGMLNIGSSPTVMNCAFIQGFASSCGGGMRNEGSSPLVMNCEFQFNSSKIGDFGGYGGGMCNSSSNPTVIDCSFDRNAAGLFSFSGGGGMYNTASNPTVTACIFSLNWGGRGGGMYNANASSPTVLDCLFSINRADATVWGIGRGGGMFNDGGSAPTITNSTFSDNSAWSVSGASGFGGGIASVDGAPSISGSGFCDNAPDHIDGAWADEGDNEFADDCVCLGDVDGDGSVGLTDLVAVLAAWGPCPGCEADVDGDGSVGLTDLVSVLSSWGVCP